MTEPDETHLNLGVLAARLKALHDLIDERDRRYAEAVRSTRELADAAFTAVRESMAKTAEALADYKTTSNEFRGTLADQAANLMPRREAETLVGTLRESVDRLREEYRATWEIRVKEAVGRYDSLRSEIQARFDTLRTEIQGLRETRSEFSGREKQEQDNERAMKWIVGLVVTIVLGVVGFIVAWVIGVRSHVPP